MATTLKDIGKFMGNVGAGLSPWLMAGNALWNIGSSIVQGSRARKMERQLDQLSANRPTWEIPAEYQGTINTYKQLMAGNMPGYEQSLTQMGQAGARARGTAERGAISSTAYGTQAGDIYQKELDAIQNLQTSQAQFKAQQTQNVVGAEQELARQKAEQWNINVNVPWQTKMNELTSRYGALTGNAANARESGMSGLMNFAGTSYYQKMLEMLQKGQTPTT